MGTVNGGFWTLSDEEREMHEALRAGTHTLAYDTKLGRLVLVPKAEAPADTGDGRGSGEAARSQ